MTELSQHLDKVIQFFQVVKSGSIRAAAAELNLNQPSLSRSMKTLESVLDTRLFIRGHEGISLTDHGKILFQYAERLKLDLQALEQQIAPSATQDQELVIGAYESIAIYFFPKLVEALGTKLPKIKPHIITAPSSKLIEQLRRGAMDIVVSVNPGHYPDVKSRVLFEDLYRLYKASTISLRDDSPLILVPSATDRDGSSVAEFVHTSDFGMRRQIVCESFESAKSLVESGLGVGILPGRVAAPLLAAGRIDEITQHSSAKKIGFGPHDIALSWSLNRDGDPSLMAVLRLIESI